MIPDYIDPVRIFGLRSASNLIDKSDRGQINELQ